MLILEELGASDQGVVLAEVAHCFLEEYDLTQKVSNFCYFYFINLKSININFLIFFPGFCYHNI